MKYPPCGRLCSSETCEGKRQGLCEGCVEAKGAPIGCVKSEHPSKYKSIEICPIWKCTSGKKLEHCGECKEFPCKIFLNWYDPKNGKKSVLPYISLLLIRKKLGTEEWVKWVKIHKAKS
jgi:hypothetical protein